MAALVTIQVAKHHLRITDDDHDADIDLKVQQASHIVIDYLKSRAHRTSTIASSSVASPTVLTMSEDHDFIDGETVVISGDDSTPSLDGSHVISNVTATTFTIPVAVTVAGTGGTAFAEWTDVTVPPLVQAAVLLVLEDLHERRPIDWDAQRRLLERSRDPAFA